MFLEFYLKIKLFLPKLGKRLKPKQAGYQTL